MSSSATDGGRGGLVSAMASATSEASSSSSSISEHSESRQVKFAVTSSSSSHCNSNGPAGVGTQSKSKERGGMSKVFQRSCSSAGVLGSLSKQQSFTATSSCKTTTEKDEKHQTGLANIPEDKVSLFAYTLPEHRFIAFIFVCSVECHIFQQFLVTMKQNENQFSHNSISFCIFCILYPFVIKYEKTR